KTKGQVSACYQPQPRPSALSQTPERLPWPPPNKSSGSKLCKRNTTACLKIRPGKSWTDQQAARYSPAGGSSNGNSDQTEESRDTKQDSSCEDSHRYMASIS